LPEVASSCGAALGELCCVEVVAAEMPEIVIAPLPSFVFVNNTSS
jgi:hypothetical protein